jgi:hypothetical protein
MIEAFCSDVPSSFWPYLGRGSPGLIVTAKMNDIDPQVWLADVLSRIAEHPAHRLDDLPPWN